MSTQPVKPAVLIVRDGWGYNPDPSQNQYNTIFQAKHPADDALSQKYPHTLIKTGGLDVGLPRGVMGNSEVGHQNIGAGRIVDQEIVRIDKAIENGSFFNNEAAVGAVNFAKANQGRLHVFGLVSDAGVHATIDHIIGCVQLGQKHGIKEVFIHAFTDGRDTPPTSGVAYVLQVEQRCQKLGIGKIATVCGRYYSMDRDKRWDRVQTAYECLTEGKGPRSKSVKETMEHYYANPTNSSMLGDEFIPATCITDNQGEPVATIRDGDAIVFANFRGDRPRELTRAFVDPDFKGFPRKKLLNLYFATMTEYEKGLNVHPLFIKPPKMDNILGMYLSQLGLTQFRCAETEKFPHVTFFFNDYREEPFPGEERGIIPSPKVATYDLQPEMSADGVCTETVNRILSKKYNVVIVNFANPDMVGHTGSLPAAIKAVEKVDVCVGKVVEAARQIGASVMITADHGNCEQTYDVANKCPHTSHTMNDVPLIVVDDRYVGKPLRNGGRLADIAPTLLELMGLPVPKEMTGQSLLLN